MVALNVNAIATYVSNLMKAQSEANTCGVIPFLSTFFDGLLT